MNPAAIAQRIYTQRRQWLRGQRANRRIDPEKAEAMLRPWAAIALRAGFVPPQCEPLLAERAFLGEAAARLSLADEFCPRAEALATLATARDKAMEALSSSSVAVGHKEAGPQVAEEQARQLDRLARHLGAPPMLRRLTPQPERKAA